MTILEKNQIRAFIQSPAWEIVERLAKELIDKIAKEPKIKDTEWETAKTAVFDSGQATGINRLLKDILNTQR